MPKIIIVQTIHEEGIKILKGVGEVVQASAIDPATLIREAADCDGLVVRTARIPAEVIDSAARLKIIARSGTGVDNIDVAAATGKGILVINSPESNIESVAEHVLGMVLALAKNMVKMDYEIRRGGFKLRNEILSTEIRGKLLGIIGIGKVGKTLARKMNGLGMEIIGYDPFIDPAVASKYGINMVNELDRLYEMADYITIHVPLNNQTRGMITIADFRKMKRSSCFINASRGSIIREADLYMALKEGLIKAAALDVFEEEPPEDNNPLFELDNIILSPHYAALTAEALKDVAVTAALGMANFFRGKSPRYIINPEVLKG